MPYDHRITGRVIRRLRRERGMSQEQLSGLAAISRSHLAEIESGRDNANVATLWRVADALGLRLSDLIHQVEEEIEVTIQFCRETGGGRKGTGNRNRNSRCRKSSKVTPGHFPFDIFPTTSIYRHISPHHM